MWRDRTNLYISYRSSYSHKPARSQRSTYPSSSAFAADEDRRGLLSPGDDDDAVIEMDLLPPRWTDYSDEVTELLGEISRKAATLDRLHSKHVLPGFDDNRSAEEGEIERLTTEITASFHRCQDKIRKITATGSNAEVAMARNMQVALATRVQDASTAFRKKQSAYLKKLRGISGMGTPLDFRTGSPALYGDGDPTADVSFSQRALQQSATLTSHDAAIMQREREITDIARGILELADIFKELQTMVIDQGTMLDRIDYNVDLMNVHVKAADKEMGVAQGYQKKTTKRKIIFLLLLLVVGLFIVVTIKPRRGAEAPAHPPPPKEQKPQQDKDPAPAAVEEELDATPDGPAMLVRRNGARIHGRLVEW
ncbi:t-snare, syntaxin [Geopyxis carbonaria]|nr:t-snare, syntaxin [Geopyxis carbonaria]